MPTPPVTDPGPSRRFSRLRTSRAAGPHAPGFPLVQAVAAGERLADQDEQARTDKCEGANTSRGKGRTEDVRR
ncbi:hypothetical protein Msi02_77520 [Microbispora siamensis]|uniref:Uncharacterized protein n=1 Tax=Microbispora siamensis TaxID=564413 RepID=A0ABQ4GZS3_9ACTN|nr:hypothetical protein Msi02_77520 [Microbispora siamensis]